MSAVSDLDRLIVDWLDEPGPLDPPDRVIEYALGVAATRGQRRARSWFMGRDFPIRSTLRLVRAPSPTWVFLIIVLVGLALGAVLVAGALRPRIPAPFGLAKPGLVALEISGDLVVANADGSGSRPLTSGPDGDTFPVFSPDGTHVAFWRASEAGLAVVVVTQNGARPVVIRLPAGATPGNPAEQVAWAPDSGHLAFAITVPPDVDPSIWTVGADGTNPTRRSRPMLFADDPAWAPSELAIAFHGGGEGSANGIYVMRNDGAEVRQVSTAAGSGFAFHAPTWRPTGDLIAFYAGNDGAHDVYVVRPDGSGERDVSNDDPRRGARPTDEYWPSWAPDGSRLAFTRNIVRDQTRAFADVVIVADADGSHATTLDPTRFLHLDPDSRLDRAQPIWSPDAAAIAGYLFNDSDGDDELITYDARDGHVLTRISTHGAGGLLSWQRLEP